MFKRPELAIFDLDNTLYDYEIANASGQGALNGFLSQHLGRPDLEISQLLDESRQRVKSRLGDTASSHSRLLYIRDLLVQLNVHTNAAFALECEQVFWREYLKKTQLFPGVEELLSILRLAGTRIAMVTDHSSQIQLRKLNWLGLGKAFDVIVTSEEAGGDKITNLPSKMLRDLVPIAGEVWCIGDNDWDHLYLEESMFFKKVKNGQVSSLSDKLFQFSDYFELSGKIERE
jgi:putative hydrolase of the HAD superfamily